jgi:hypothetical protein
MLPINRSRAGALILVAIMSLAACSSNGNPSTEDVNKDTSIDISPTLTGDESIEMGDINTGDN